MSRNYYAGVYRDGSGELVDIIRYHSDTFGDEDVREHWRTETSPAYDAKGVHRRRLRAKDVRTLAKRVCGIGPYERFFGEIAWTRVAWGYSDSMFATSPEIITHH